MTWVTGKFDVHWAICGCGQAFEDKDPVRLGERMTRHEMRCGGEG